MPGARRAVADESEHHVHRDTVVGALPSEELTSMNRTFGLLAAGASILFSVALAAVERPTPEFQSLMKSNVAIVDLIGGGITFGRDTNIDSGIAGAEPAIRAHLKAKDFDAIVKDAAT